MQRVLVLLLALGVCAAADKHWLEVLQVPVTKHNRSRTSSNVIVVVARDRTDLSRREGVSADSPAFPANAREARPQNSGVWSRRALDPFASFALRYTATFPRLASHNAGTGAVQQVPVSRPRTAVAPTTTKRFNEAAGAARGSCVLNTASLLTRLQEDAEAAFEAFTSQLKREYDASELGQRKEVFMANLKMINEHNAANSGSYYVSNKPHKNAALLCTLQ